MQRFFKQLIFLFILAVVFGIVVFVVVAVNNRGNAPVAYWKFDEGAGPTAYDAVGANDGTITNALWRNEPDCKSGKCLYFDGTTDYIDVGNVGGTIKTISFWVRLKDTSTQKIIDIDGADYIEIDGSNQISTQSFPGTTAYYVNAVNTQAITANSWQFIVITDTTGVSPTDFDIGVHDLGGTPSYFTGYLDDIKIYDYARSSAQIKADYLAGSVGRGATLRVGSAQEQQEASKGLLGYWKLDETSGNAADSSGAGLTLTNNNTVPFVAGKYGNSADFTPASSHNFSTATSVSSVKTIAFWTYPDSTTNNYFDLTSAVYLTSSSGTLTATGFTSPVIYVNGVQSSIISASVWSHIAVVTNTGVTSNAIAFGKANSAYFDGKLDDIKIYNTSRTADQIMLDYDTGPPPVAHWKMDEKVSGDAKTLYDTSGSNNGTTYWGANASGMSCAKPGKYGSACEFDGVDDYANLTSNAVLDDMPIFTYSLFFKHNITSEDGFLNKRYNLFEVTGGDKLRGDVSTNGTSAQSISTNIVSTGIWNYAAMTYDDSGDRKIRLYLNGIEVSYSPQTAATGTRSSDSAEVLSLGRWYDASRYWDGLIDDVRIYNYARTQKQIIQDMNAGHPAVGSPVGSYVAYWDFNEGQGAVAFDKSNNNNDGAITGADWTLNGKFGGALDFESGNGDYVSVNESTIFEGMSGLTLSTWVKFDILSGIQTIIDRWYDGGSERPYLLQLYNGNIRCGINSNTNGDTSLSLSTGIWYHLVCAYDGANKRIYINGVLQTTTAQTGAIQTGMTHLYIGAGYVPSVISQFFDGLIDEVKIYPFALSPAEIKQEYNQGKTMVLGSPRNSSSTWDDGGFGGAAPIAIWKMDEKANDTCSGGVNDVCDTSQNSNDGAIAGAVWKSAGECKIG